MLRIDLEGIKHDLSHYIDLVEQGEVLVILRHDREVAEIKPLASKALSSRPYALCAGEFAVPDDFDAPLPDEILSDFEGR